MRDNVQNRNAYDLNYFAATEKETRPKLYVATTTRRQKQIGAQSKRIFKIIMLSTLFLTLVASVLYMQSVSTMLNGEIAKQEEILLELQSEYGYLNNEIEMKTNLNSVEEYALTQLGLVKRNSSQTVYIYRDGKSEITYTQTLWNRLTGIFMNNLDDDSLSINT